jgi:hypothetical protein
MSFGNFDYVLSDPSAATATTMVHDFLNEYCMRPWNEIFIDDAPDQSWLVFRPFPYRNRHGNYVGYTAFGTTSSATQAAGTTNDSTSYTPPSDDRADAMQALTVTPEETVSFTLVRSDEEVVNYLFTNATFVGMGGGFEPTMLGNNLDNTNPHFTFHFTSSPLGYGSPPPDLNLEYSQMELFGFREIRWPTRYISVNPKDLGDPNQYSNMYGDSAGSNNLWAMGQQLNMIMFFSLEHNSQLESGEIIICGREDIRPGMFIQFRHKRSDPTYYMYYVAEVSQSLVPYETWLTKLTVIRGEGYLKPDGEVTPTSSHKIVYDGQDLSGS